MYMLLCLYENHFVEGYIYSISMLINIRQVGTTGKIRWFFTKFVLSQCGFNLYMHKVCQHPQPFTHLVEKALKPLKLVENRETFPLLLQCINPAAVSQHLLEEKDGWLTVCALSVNNTRSLLQAVPAGTAAAVSPARPLTGETAGVTPEEESTEAEHRQEEKLHPCRHTTSMIGSINTQTSWSQPPQ